MKYSVVIPTYNHCDDLLKPCIDSLLKYSKISDIELVVSANGCKDNTYSYLQSLKEKFDSLGLNQNLKIVWNDNPLGYSRACNEGIKVSTTNYIVLLNNDVVFLEQYKNQWLDILENEFNTHVNCGVSCIVKSFSEPAGHDFAIFFLVMIHRKVFDKIGLLNTEYGVGGGEDTEFCIEAERAGFLVCEVMPKRHDDEKYVGGFPVYHKGEGTMHDATLVPEWDDIFLDNSLRLAKKYNPAWYQWRLSNHSERAVIFKGDTVPDKEVTRYRYAAENLIGKKVFELGCTSGYGIQFLPKDVEYTGLDYDSRVIEAAKEQDWGYNAKFIAADINKYELDQYDTIIAFEVIEHLDNGLEVVERLKKHCKRLIITVPMMEPPGRWSPHHKLFNLDESKFPGFKYKFIAPDGTLRDQPHMRGDTENYSLMLCVYDSEAQPSVDISFLRDQHKEIYKEIIEENCYDVTPAIMKDKVVIDIGANIGAFAFQASLMGAKKVYAIEPVSSTFMQLCSNINKSKLRNIVPMKNAVSANAGEFVNISLTMNSGHNSMYVNSSVNEAVYTTSLPELLNQINSNDIILKIDCEGAEYDILLNMSPGSMRKISRIVLESHADLHPVYKGHEILENKLKELGFVSENIKQVYSWEINEKGERVNWKEIPYRIGIWKR